MSATNFDATSFVRAPGYAGSAEPTKQRTSHDRYLVARHVDGFLVGWFAVAFWFVATVLRSHGHPLDLSAPGIAWPATVIAATHFVISWRYAYTGERARHRARPMALVALPLFVIAVAVTAAISALSGHDQLSGRITANLVALVFFTSGWHYIKQAYGVLRLAASFRGVRLHRIETTVLRYGIYPAWIFGLRRSPWLVHLPSGSIPPLISIARIAVWAGLGSIVVALASVWKRTGTVPPSTMVAPYAAAVVWLIFPINLLGATMVTAMFHSLQYLACCHRAELSRPERPRRESATDAALRKEEIRNWLTAFATAAAIGVLLVNSIPHLLDRTLQRSVPTGMFTTLFFVTLNLTHYIIDAVIWRSDAPIVRSIGASTQPRAL